MPEKITSKQDELMALMNKIMKLFEEQSEEIKELKKNVK